MPNFTPSANMNMPIPTVGVDPGPDYANNLNSSLTILDSHNHAAGSGVQINPAGININADLPFNINNALSLRSCRFTAQGSPISGSADLNCISVSGVDLYYRDGNGNSVRITSGGAVAGTPGSIANLSSPASASYVSGSGTFVFQSGANIPGNIDGASFIIRDQTLASNGVTLNAPASLASNYSLTLPSALPGATHFLSVDSSGNIGDSWVVDNSSIQVSSNTVQVKAQGIVQAMKEIRTSGTSVGSGGIAISGTSSTFSGSNNSFTDILSVTLVTNGNPVMIMLQPDGSSVNDSYVESNNNHVTLKLDRDSDTATYISETLSASSHIPPSAFSALDIGASAGSHTYRLQSKVDAGSYKLYNLKLVAYEL